MKMKKFPKRVALFVVLSAVGFLSLLLAPTAFAHYTWIETTKSSQAGERVEIQLCYGEFPHREKAGGRLEEIRGVKLWVSAPGGGEDPVVLAEEGNHYRGTMNVKAVGRYNILATFDRGVVDWSKNGIGVVRAIYFSRTQVGQSENQAPEGESKLGNYMELDVVPVTENLMPVVGSEVVVRVLFHQKPLADAKLVVHAGDGWMQEVKTDAWGIAAFPIEREGWHVVEVIHQEPVAGEYEGRKYQATRYRATLSLFARKP